MLIHYRLRQRVNKAAALSVIALLCTTAQIRAQSGNDPALLKRQEGLISKRADLQRNIQNAERQLHKVELDRRDKLEELEQLCGARAELNQRHSFSKDIDNEIANQTRNLRTIEGQRSDYLEELEALHMGLSQVNRDVADGDRQLR
jgi:chromosome segregation ATPase